MAEIIWSDPALDDLRSIYDYISVHSTHTANNLVNRIMDRTEQLIEHPHMGRMVPETENETIRELIEGNYRIFYRLLSEDNLEILRVWHSARGKPQI